MTKMYPVKMNPVLKDYIWGGEKLKMQWNKRSELEKVAESWELSAHPNGQTTAANGALAGKTLGELIAEWPGCIGQRHHEEDFPILIKLIDARENLSIQVHPDNEYARQFEGDNGKTEVWYVLDAENGAGLICGFSEDMTKDEYRRRIENNTLTEALNFFSVKKGDVLFIRPGTVHAICAGLLIAEVQQSSDITYRVYDYGRVGTDGAPRQLHIEKALDVTDLEHFGMTDFSRPETVRLGNNTKRDLCLCDYFSVSEFRIGEDMRFNCDRQSFNALTFLDGEGVIEYDEKQYPFHKGDTYFLPAGLGIYKVSGYTRFLLTRT